MPTKYSKITVTNHSEHTGAPNDIKVLINIGEHFIDETSIRAVARFGKGSKITLNSGQEIVVDAPYERVAPLVSKAGK